MHSNLYDYLGDLSPLGITIVCAIIYGLAVGILYPMRLVFEGAMYNTAYSSKVGDGFLIAIFFFAWVLLVNEFVSPAWATGWGWLCVAVVVATGVAGLHTFGPGPLGKNHVTDLYHNSFVMWLITFVLVWVAPLILFNGSHWTPLVGIGLIGVWVVLVVSDFSTGRMHQRPWLKANDPTTYALLVRHDRMVGRAPTE